MDPVSEEFPSDPWQIHSFSRDRIPQDPMVIRAREQPSVSVTALVNVSNLLHCSYRVHSLPSRFDPCGEVRVLNKVSVLKRILLVHPPVGEAIPSAPLSARAFGLFDPVPDSVRLLTSWPFFIVVSEPVMS
jgi:hypothetical protein